jgi:uncharacterized protein with HEPN domain
MRGKRSDRVRVQHIYDAILEIESYLLDKEFSDFMSNSMMRFACIKQLEIIGEAGNHVSDTAKLNFSSIEWAQIVGMRNVFVHEYFGVDPTLVWEILKNDLPDLKIKINEILNSFDQTGNT